MEIKSRWLTLIGEYLEDSEGEKLEYWRVEKPDSLVIIPTIGDKYVEPQRYFRPGCNKYTFDFPGGRIEPGKNINDAACEILKRELSIEWTQVTKTYHLNEKGYLINSSFSNQKLFGIIVNLKKECADTKELNFLNLSSFKDTLDKLSCLQCRQVFIDYLQWNNML